MMAAMDSCMDMVKKHGAGLWDSFFTEKERFLERCSSLKRLQVLTDGTKWSRKMTSETGFLMDSGKILSETSKTCLTGKRFYDILLKQYHLQMEMAAGNYVTAIMTCCDTADGWQRLWDTLKEIDDFCVAADEPVQENRKLLAYPVLKQQISLTDALDAPKAQGAAYRSGRTDSWCVYQSVSARNSNCGARGTDHAGSCRCDYALQANESPGSGSRS